MSMHKIELTELERAGLEAHHLAIGTPSQLSDCFRHGVAWTLSQHITPKAQIEELLPKLLMTIENISTELSDAILEVNSERMKYNRRRSDKDVRMLNYSSVVDAQILLAEIMEEGYE